jgi:acetyl esterase/lipase
MPLQLDSDITAALAASAEAATAIGLPERDDALALREVTNQTLAILFANLPCAPNVKTTSVGDVAAVPMRWHTRGDDKPGAAIVYVHGGGMIAGSVDIYEPLVRHYVQLTGVPFLAMDYRLAPEFHDTTPVEDAFAATRWLFEHADQLDVDPTRIALMGDSGGGGVAAGTAILARDHGVQLARQILIYPMLDDRNTTPDPALAPTATWTYDNNFTGWHALLGDAIGGPSVSQVAAPARLHDFAGLAAACIEVGELDIFRDESIDYARRLIAAGVSCELHVVPGAPHAHDLIGMPFAIGRRSLDEKVRAINSV